MTAAEILPPTQVPRILFVDDNDQISSGQLLAALAPNKLEVLLRHPEEVYLTDLEWADLVVVDYFLTDWPERDEIDSVARAPHDGLAVAATLRSALLPSLNERGAGALPARTVAFALWSSNLKEATFDLPENVLPHVFSRDNNLEWAFRRAELLDGDGGNRMAVLAQAVAELPHEWPTEPRLAAAQLVHMLGLSPTTNEGATWEQQARNEIFDCGPPIHELSERSHGLALLRWMMHRILPYPCFLMDEKQLGARLRVDELGSTDSDLRKSLEPLLYRGSLQDFGGPRWWRAGVESWLFEATDGQSGNPRLVADVARALGGVAYRDWIRPVVVIDGELTRLEDYAEVEDTVRVRPDDWPAYADDAFARRDAVAVDSRLRSLVDSADLDLLAVATLSTELE